MNIRQIFGLLSLAVLEILTACGGGSAAPASSSTQSMPPTITSSGALPDGAVSTPYSASLTATGGTTPYSWAIKNCSGVCDPNLSLSQAGVFSGTPANSGSSTYNVGVTDAMGQTASAALTLTIAGAPVSITSPSTLQSGMVSVPYSTSLTATGGTTPYSWAIRSCSGLCDPNLSLSQTGVFSGTPANSGTSTYSVGVTDAKGQTASAALSLTIAPPPVSITSSGALPDGVISTPYSASLTATGGTTPYSWAIKNCSGVCDPNLNLGQSGVFSGTPANPGTSTYNVGVTDAKGQIASVVLTLRIAVKPLAITSSSTLPNGVVSNPYSSSLTATGGTTPYSWVIKNCSGLCDSNLSLSQAGVFSGTPFNSGSSTYNVGVSDSMGQTVSASVSLNISPNSAGANYFVSPSGSDLNPCSQTSPCATPDHAFNVASPGQIVQVAPGTYDYGSGGANFTKSGTAGNFITVTCATRGACKIQSATTGNTTVVALQGNYMTFDGFEVTDTSAAGNNLGLYVTSSFVNITHNTIHHIETDCGSAGGGGIQLTSNTHDVKMDSNRIYDIGWPDGGSPKCPSSTVQTDGILPETNGAGIIITNNIIYHVSGGWGIGAGGHQGGANNPFVISNNLVFSNSNGGILIDYTGDYSTITNNIVLNNGVVAAQCGINTIYASDSHILEANNDVYANAGGDYCSAGLPIQTNNISVNPASGTTFVNWQPDGSGDYHEKAGSPTIDHGTSSTDAPTHDFDGNPRPQGVAYDIGPYEYPN